MNVAAILSAITMTAHYAGLAVQIGESAAPFLAKIAEWAKPGAVVTQSDVDALHAMAKPYFDMLNDTSRDV